MRSPVVQQPIRTTSPRPKEGSQPAPPRKVDQGDADRRWGDTPIERDVMTTCASPAVRAGSAA